jgi:hypothetical protein
MSAASELIESLPPEEQERVKAVLELARKQGRRGPQTGAMIMPAETTDVGPDGFVKKTVTPDATSVADILERNEKELGYIHITYTVQGVNVGWSSAQPVIPLSHFLQALDGESSRTEESGENFSGSLENESEGMTGPLFDALNGDTEG